MRTGIPLSLFSRNENELKWLWHREGRNLPNAGETAENDPEQFFMLLENKKNACSVDTAAGLMLPNHLSAMPWGNEKKTGRTERQVKNDVVDTQGIP